MCFFSLIENEKAIQEHQTESKSDNKNHSYDKNSLTQNWLLGLSAGTQNPHAFVIAIGKGNGVFSIKSKSLKLKEEIS